MDPYDRDFVRSQIKEYLQQKAYMTQYRDPRGDPYRYWQEIVDAQPLTLVVKNVRYVAKEDDGTHYWYDLLDYKTGWWFSNVEFIVGEKYEAKMPKQIGKRRNLLAIDTISAGVERTSWGYWMDAVEQAHWLRKVRKEFVPPKFRRQTVVPAKIELVGLYKLRSPAPIPGTIGNAAFIVQSSGLRRNPDAFWPSDRERRSTISFRLDGCLVREVPIPRSRFLDYKGVASKTVSEGYMFAEHEDVFYLTTHPALSANTVGADRLVSASIGKSLWLATAHKQIRRYLRSGEKIMSYRNPNFLVAAENTRRKKEILAEKTRGVGIRTEHGKFVSVVEGIAEYVRSRKKR